VTAELPLLAAALLAVIGLIALVAQKNIIKMILGVGLLEGAVNLFLVAVGYRAGGVAPIYTGAPSTRMVLPTVQAMTLTSIVIGVATMSLLLAFAVLLYRRYGTLDQTKLNRLQG
jgi:multicomponent Na+:H+ antiporter subunit C